MRTLFPLLVLGCRFEAAPLGENGVRDLEAFGRTSLGERITLTDDDLFEVSEFGRHVAVDQAGTGLVAGEHEHGVDVHVAGPRHHERDALGDVLGRQRRHAGVHRVGSLRVAVEAHQAPLGADP